MGDYIDRIYLLNDLKTSVVFSGRSGVDSKELKGANKIIDRIIAMPTEDVQEVKHGEWGVAIGYDTRKKVNCSICNLMTFEPTNYCPHCGAKMDGGNNA